MIERAPPFAFEWDMLAAVAADLHADRVRAYPDLVEKGRLTAEEAASGIRVMGTIAADWKRIERLRGGGDAEPCALVATVEEKRATLAAAIDRLQSAFDRALAALPRMMPAALGSRSEVVDCAGLTLDDMIHNANDGRIAVAPLRPICNARDRLLAAQAMLWHAESWPSAMRCAETQAAWIAERAAAAAEVAAA